MTIIVVVVVPCCRSALPVCVRGRWLLFKGAGCCSWVLAVVRGRLLSFVGAGSSFIPSAGDVAWSCHCRR